MALRDEQADILGGPILQRPETGLYAMLSQYRILFKSVTLFGLGLLVWIACARGFEHLKKHRELRYRKAMRRKHGIPDSDCRPFAVAYAAAKRAHLEREAQDRKKLTNYVSDHNLPAVDQRTNAQKGARGLRRRVPETAVQLHDYQSLEKQVPILDNKRPGVHSLDFSDWCNPNPRRRTVVPEPLPVERFHSLRANTRGFIINPDDSGESRKRSFEDENDVEHENIKKSRMDENEPGDRYAQYSNMQRAPEESLDRQPESNYVRMQGQGSRCMDDLRDGDREPVDEAMEGIDKDVASEPVAVTRGRKRDRAEAESTFGGDDLEEDIRNGKASHHRKRRTVSQRGIEISTRGQKRDREAESPESEGDEGGSEASRRRAQRSSKKKRDKRVASDEVGEISVDDPCVSKAPLCGGRRVGDEWEEDGVQYKVSEKGERLRLTLVKKARNKYHMPQDSQHPDRSAALEIYVETWMTDKQHKQAEGRQELAWQEPPRESSGSKTPDVLDSPTKNGKNLLWDSVKGGPARRPFRQFMPAGALIRINPFEQWQLQPTLGRRVASCSTTVSPVLSGVADSPTRPGFRGFSKWEKQDREAEAMARIRAKIEEQRKVHASPAPPKLSEIPTSMIAPELGTKPLSVPTIILVPTLGSSSTESKPTFTFGTSTEGSQSTSTFGGNKDNSKAPSVFDGSVDGPKPTFVFGNPAETSKPTSAFGGAIEGTKSTFAFSNATKAESTSAPVTQGSNSPIPTDASKLTSNPGTTAFRPSSSTFSFGKTDEPTTNTANSSNTKPVPSFIFGTPSGATGSIFGQPSSVATSSESSQTVFGRHINATPNSFGFTGTGGSGSSSAFGFGKPTTQNQKQEQ